MRHEPKKSFRCLSFFHLALILSLAFMIAPSAEGKTQTQEIQTLIRQQLEAFNEEDYFSAYQYASRHIQSEFTLKEFEMMVRTGYPQIAKSKQSRFGDIELFDEGRHARAIVHVTGADHVTIITQYRLIYEDGAWRNNGVMILDRNRPI